MINFIVRFRENYREIRQSVTSKYRKFFSIDRMKKVSNVKNFLSEADSKIVNYVNLSQDKIMKFANLLIISRRGKIVSFAFGRGKNIAKPINLLLVKYHKTHQLVA